MGIILFPLTLYIIIYMQYTIEELRQEAYSKVYEVYDIFKDFFGEDKVDLQDIVADSALENMLTAISCSKTDDKWEMSTEQLDSIKRVIDNDKPFILVYWPEVTVTNENNRSVVIQDLYAKIELTAEGRIPYENRGFQLNRTTFPSKQYVDGYLHSHVMTFHRIPRFDNPCLGRGPINHTIMSLKNEFDSMTWMMFCQELAMYVTVESLRGVPYKYLERIGKKEGGALYDYNDYSNPSNISRFYSDDTKEFFLAMLKDFSKYYLKHGHLQFGYDINTFKCGMSFFDFLIDISNSFIEWYNKYGDKTQINSLYSFDIIKTVRAAEGKFYEANGVSSTDRHACEGIEILTFKGESKRLHILNDEEDDLESTTIMNKNIAMYILHGIINILNYRYRNEYNYRHRGESAATEAIAPSPYETVFYI